jgi:putative FmdB family regulatory protein
MPTYDYRCGGCRHEFESFQSITAEPLRKCPKCGKMKLKRLIGTGAALIFRGSGFYITDYKKGRAPSKGPGDGASKKESSSETSSSGGGDDTKRD